MHKEDMTRRLLSVPVDINPDIKIIQKSKVRTYRNVPVLTPGEYNDALSRTTCDYPLKTLRECAMNWSGTYLDIDHDISHVLSRIGWVEPKGWNDKKNAVMVDMKILPVTNNTKDTIALIDNKLINAVSIEAFTSDTWDDEKGMPSISNIDFCGLAIVTVGACDGAMIS